MSFAIITLFIVLVLFVGMILLQEFGRHIGARRLAIDPEGARAGTGAIDGAVFALLGLLVAFTFSGAATRFDLRRQLVVEEANNIGTAYLRLDLLPRDAKDSLRKLFGQYLDSRLETYRKLPDLDAAKKEMDRSSILQNEIWVKAVTAAAAKDVPPSAAMLLLPALNQMIDITTTRTMNSFFHPPPTIFLLLIGLGLGCSVMAGYGMAGGKKRSLTHMIGFAAVLAITVYVILDIEYPRLGLIRVDAVDQVLIDLRKTMGP